MTTLRQTYFQEYQALVNAYHRCHNPNHKAYEDYGARGIKVCPEWQPPFMPALAQFIADIGPCPHPSLTLDRIDNDGNYELGNVAWRTRAEQGANRRPYSYSREKNPIITHKGVSKSLMEWANQLGVDHTTLSHRIYRYGMTLDEALVPGRAKRRKLH